MTVAADTLQLATELGQLLLLKKWRITTAESCTGGGISYWLTAVAGSSSYVDRAFVTYSNESKQQLLAVKGDTLASWGAVSEETVSEMAIGAAKAASADFAISVSGVAGPGGGSVDKPVGTVWFGFFMQGQVFTLKRVFSGDRQSVRQQAINFALKQSIEMLTVTTQ